LLLVIPVSISIYLIKPYGAELVRTAWFPPSVFLIMIFVWI